MNLKTRTIFYLALLMVVFTLQPSISLAQDFPRICLEDPANLMPNCKFDNGLSGWQPFTESGGANITYLQGGGECHAPQCPAAYIVVENTFVGGIFQQVQVGAGNTYYTNINWLVFDSLVNDASINDAVDGGIGRRIGIDPFGGTDSTSPNIVWSTDNWRTDCKTCQVEFVTATAQADVITVFIRIDDTWRQRAAEKGFQVPTSKDQFWLDEVGLKQIAGDAAPAIQPLEAPPTDAPTNEPVPTDTPAVSEATPTAPKLEVTPTATPTTAEPSPVSEAAETQPVSPLGTPTEPAEGTEAAVIAAPPTLTPTLTRTPTLSPTPRPTREATPTRHPTIEPAAASIMPGGILGIAGTTLCAGGLILVIMAVAIAGLVWLYHLGWGKSDDDLFDDDYDDDDSVDVEIVEE
jgi:hypothetical protein